MVSLKVRLQNFMRNSTNLSDLYKINNILKILANFKVGKNFKKGLTKKKEIKRPGR